MSRWTRIVCFSDTHGRHRQMRVPEGDVLLCAGDVCGHGTIAELADFANWFKMQPHKYKVIVAGNHDWPFERSRHLARAMLGERVEYLQDQETMIRGMTVYGSPWQPEFFGWAFNVPRGPELARIWERIPEDVDVLVTHGPPEGILDHTEHGIARNGCADLRKRLAIVKPRLHVFGHNHLAAGVQRYGGTMSVNASVVNPRYELVRGPVVVEINDEAVRLVSDGSKGDGR